MANVVVIGSQWGDEGKGKIVDWLSERAEVVVRFQGGHNAGHTLVIDNVTYKLSLLPSGISDLANYPLLVTGLSLILGHFLMKLNFCKNRGSHLPENLVVAENASLICPCIGLDRREAPWAAQK